MENSFVISKKKFKEHLPHIPPKYLLTTRKAPHLYVPSKVHKLRKNFQQSSGERSVISRSVNKRMRGLSGAAVGLQESRVTFTPVTPALG